jgi:predicted peroxiredoxin
VEGYSPHLPDVYNSRSTELASSRTTKLDWTLFFLIHFVKLVRRKWRERRHEMEFKRFYDGV